MRFGFNYTHNPPDKMKPLMLLSLLMLCTLTRSSAQTSHAINAQPITHLPDSVTAMQRSVTPVPLKQVVLYFHRGSSVVRCEQHTPQDIFRICDTETAYRILRLTAYAYCEDGRLLFGDETLWLK